MLERSLKAGQLSHAYLFVGPPHVGKMTLAINLAQAVNCEAEEPPCTECIPCRRIASGIHSDVQIISLTSPEKAEIGIDQIRELHHAASLPPFEGKHKVFIIDRAELLSTEAANCLLKTLEEPLPRVLLILLSSKERLLLPTIVSRCQRIELAPLLSATIKEVLTGRTSPERAELLARLSGGCLGWALSAAQDEQILMERSQQLTRLIELDQASREQRFSYAAELATQFSKNREEVEEVLSLWLNWWRDLLLVKGGGSQFISNLDYQSTLFRYAQAYSLRQIRDFIYAIEAAAKQLDQNANPRLVLEVLMLNIPEGKETEIGAG